MNNDIDLSEATVQIRVADTNDAIELIEYSKKVGQETNFLSFGSEGFDISFAKEVEIIEQYELSLNSIMLVLEIQEQIIGIGTLAGRTSLRENHVAELGISILKEYWGNGLGQILMEELIQFARESKLEVITLEVVKNNERAVHLYQKMGFQIVGNLSKRFKNENTYFNTYIMELIL